MKPDVHIWSQAPQAYTNQRLATEARKRGHNVFLEDPHNTPARAHPHSLLILRSTGLDYSDYDIRLADLWQQKGLLTPANPLVLSGHLRDKFLAYTCLRQRQIPTPLTLLLDDPQLEFALKGIKNGIIVKPRRSNQGKGLFVLDTLASLKSVARAWQDLGDTRFVVQPKLSKKREWRILSLGKRPLLWILRTAKNEQEVLGNRSFSHERLFDAHKDLVTWKFENELITKLSELSCWGADVIETKEGHFYVLEVNPSPGLFGPEELTQENLCGEWLNSTLRTLSDQS